MRGEITRLDVFQNRTQLHNRGDGTPSTPGTASSTRTNPPIYQRMHSNDSSKGSDKDNGSGSTLGRTSD